MSIIAEALKKAQETSSKKAGSQTREVKKGKPHFYTVIAICVLVLFLGVLLFSFLRPGSFETGMTRGRYPDDDSKDLTENPESPPYVVETLAKEEGKEILAPEAPLGIRLADVTKTIKLYGIMYTPRKPLAVINDNIWAEGDTVRGFKILKIEKDFVKVASNGQEFVIRLKR